MIGDRSAGHPSHIGSEVTSVLILKSELRGDRDVSSRPDIPLILRQYFGQCFELGSDQDRHEGGHEIRKLEGMLCLLAII